MSAGDAKPAKRRKPKPTWWQRACFNAPLNPPRDTERVIPKHARMGVKANDN